MNHADLKSYAQQARREFIQAVKDRAAHYGVTAAKIEPVTEKGDVAIIGGHALPVSVVTKREKLLERIERDGFSQTMEALAYTWFNRFVAIRFMELHGYLEHGYRVLSHPDPTKTIPEILELAEHVDLLGLSKEKVIDLKLDGNKESELYQMLLLAQCHALHSAMPFLFEGIDDETELVLPENLLHSDSIIRKLVSAGDPDDWQEVEVLGWLYQFYISERKDEVMARKSIVPTEDIPAVTQLFTPHWVVRYLVENSLGRLWLLNRPGSRLREHMPYYVEGEAETDFLKITKPEEIQLLDPACGSGHMLTYAFDLLFLIYKEEGYVPDEIPALILRLNLCGLEICPRAAQLANLALVFKAREKSRRFIQQGNLVEPRILALQDVHFDDSELRDYIAALDLGDLFNEPMLQLLHQFENAKTFGSLIQPCLGEAGITYARGAIEAKDLGGQLFLHQTHAKVLRVLEQAKMLCQRYHVVVANPPYMGAKGFNGELKSFLEKQYSDFSADTYSCFIVGNLSITLNGGFVAMITLPGWMFIDSYETLRSLVFESFHLRSLVHNGRGVWGSDFGSCEFIIEHSRRPDLKGQFKKLYERPGEVNTNEELERRFLDDRRETYHVSPNEFRAIPRCPLAFWVSPRIREVYNRFPALSTLAELRKGLSTGENERFIRYFWEVSDSRTALKCTSREEAAATTRKWFPVNKGGEYRRWYGNQEFVINWEGDGRALNSFRPRSVIRSPQKYFRPNIAWSKVTIGAFGSRYFPEGFIPSDAVSAVYPEDANDLFPLLGLLNSVVMKSAVADLSATINFEIGQISVTPVCPDRRQFAAAATKAVQLARADWNNFETSWDFSDLPLLRDGTKMTTLSASCDAWRDQCAVAMCQMQELEKENNRLFIEAYGLEDELTPEVPEEQIGLWRSDARREMAAFLSYAIGCMMGRYSLDKAGLILADAGDSLVEYLAKVGRPLDRLIFVPDDDGIIPVLDGEWFKDDIVTRLHAFLRATFGEANLEVNLRFIEESLGKDPRKYFLADFYKDHLQTYKKRPIYWLFSSGKERAFQALIYLHRYHEGSLSRMRTEYVIPFQGKIASRIDQLTDDIQKATSASNRKKMEKERDALLRQRTELQAFDEKLRHYADQRIQLDLDEGVKANYAKFGDLLAEVNTVTGGSDE
jgi:hypothetical protein